MTDLRKAAEMALEALEGALSDDKPYIKKSVEAMSALRQALAQPEHPLDKKADNARELGLDYEPEQEPVAWQVMVENEPMREFTIKEVAHDWTVTEKRNGSKYSYWLRPLYAAPPKREWVGLTDKERVQAFADAGLELAYMDYDADMKISKVIEAKLREKNT